MMVTSPHPTTARFRGSSKLWQGIGLACLLCMEARQVHGGDTGDETHRVTTPQRVLLVSTRSAVVRPWVGYSHRERPRFRLGRILGLWGTTE